MLGRLFSKKCTPTISPDEESRSQCPASLVLPMIESGKKGFALIIADGSKIQTARILGFQTSSGEPIVTVDLCMGGSAAHILMPPVKFRDLLVRYGWKNDTVSPNWTSIDNWVRDRLGPDWADSVPDWVYDQCPARHTRYL